MNDIFIKFIKIVNENKFFIKYFVSEIKLKNNNL